MHDLLAILIVVAGCGRIGFDPVGGGGGGDDGGAASDGVVDVPAGSVVPVFRSGVQASSMMPTNNLGAPPVTVLAGDLVLAFIGWRDVTTSIAMVGDGLGGGMLTAASGKVTQGTVSQAVYYVFANTAGTRDVTVMFTTSAAAPDVRVVTFRGVDRTTPFEVKQTAVGNGTMADSGAIVTTVDLQRVVVGITSPSMATAGSESTLLVSSTNGNVVENQVAATAGTYGATGSIAASGSWVMTVLSVRPI